MGRKFGFDSKVCGVTGRLLAVPMAKCGFAGDVGRRLRRCLEGSRG